MNVGKDDVTRRISGEADADDGGGGIDEGFDDGVAADDLGAAVTPVSASVGEPDTAPSAAISSQLGPSCFD